MSVAERASLGVQKRSESQREHQIKERLRDKYKDLKCDSTNYGKSSKAFESTSELICLAFSEVYSGCTIEKRLLGEWRGWSGGGSEWNKMDKIPSPQHILMTGRPVILNLTKDFALVI